VNNRKILAALANLCGGEDFMINITVAIDKLDKIGLDKVKEELALKGLLEKQIGIIETYLSISGNEEEKLAKAEALVGNDPEGAQGISELKYLHSLMPGLTGNGSYAGKRT
jgi:histidyl-tRNA synthetase